MFPLITLNSSHWQVDIVLFEDRVQHLNRCCHSWSKVRKLTSLIMFSLGFVALELSHANENNYRDQHLTNQFPPPFFFSNCGFQMFAQMNKCFLLWLCQCNLGMKGLKNCLLFVLITSLCQQVSIPLQKMQPSSISSGGTTFSPYNVVPSLIKFGRVTSF
jgi:aspartyl aminopeptidase